MPISVTVTIIAVMKHGVYVNVRHSMSRCNNCWQSASVLCSILDGGECIAKTVAFNLQFFRW